MQWAGVYQYYQTDLSFTTRKCCTCASSHLLGPHHQVAVGQVTDAETATAKTSSLSDLLPLQRCAADLIFHTRQPKPSPHFGSESASSGSRSSHQHELDFGRRGLYLSSATEYCSGTISTITAQQYCHLYHVFQYKTKRNLEMVQIGLQLYCQSWFFKLGARRDKFTKIQKVPKFTTDTRVPVFCCSSKCSLRNHYGTPDI